MAEWIKIGLEIIVPTEVDLKSRHIPFPRDESRSWTSLTRNLPQKKFSSNLKSYHPKNESSLPIIIFQGLLLLKVMACRAPPPWIIGCHCFFPVLVARSALLVFRSSECLASSGDGKETQVWLHHWKLQHGDWKWWFGADICFILISRMALFWAVVFKFNHADHP